MILNSGNSYSWYFADLSRNQSIEILNREPDIGVFLVRNSSSISGDLVLTVKEDSKISHYIINKVEENNETRFRIGENTFCDLPNLLTFYKHHFLDSTPLIRTATKKNHYVRAKFDFIGKDTEDLSFSKNEILTVIAKQEIEWWTAKNEKGETGVIPVPYVETIDEEDYHRERGNTSGPLNDLSSLSSSVSASVSSTTLVNGNANLNCHNDNESKTNIDSSPKRRQSLDSSHSSISGNSLMSSSENKSLTGSGFNGNNSSSSFVNGIDNNGKRTQTNYNRKLPARALVVQQRIPNAYDKKALRLEVCHVLFLFFGYFLINFVFFCFHNRKVILFW